MLDFIKNKYHSFRLHLSTWYNSKSTNTYMSQETANEIESTIQSDSQGTSPTSSQTSIQRINTSIQNASNIIDNIEASIQHSTIQSITHDTEHNMQHSTAQGIQQSSIPNIELTVIRNIIFSSPGEITSLRKTVSNQEILLKKQKKLIEKYNEDFEDYDKKLKQLTS